MVYIRSPTKIFFIGKLYAEYVTANKKSLDISNSLDILVA